MQIPLVGNFIAFVHEDWEPPLIGQVLAVNETDVLVHWWAQIRYSLWKPCFQSESPWTENIPIKDIVHKFKWEDAKNGIMANLSKSQKKEISSKYIDHS